MYPDHARTLHSCALCCVHLSQRQPALELGGPFPVLLQVRVVQETGRERSTALFLERVAFVEI